MAQSELETIREIENTARGSQKIPAAKVKPWLSHPAVEVLGAVTQHIVRQSRRVEPPLSMEEICSTVEEYYRAGWGLLGIDAYGIQDCTRQCERDNWFQPCPKCQGGK